jgi:hypothetical protein
MAKKTKKTNNVVVLKTRILEIGVQKQTDMLAEKQDYENKQIKINYIAEEKISKIRIKLQEELKKAKTIHDEKMRKIEERYI